jgi:hypothetical protein
MSANTGRAPAFRIALAVDTNVKLGTITSSPAPMPAASIAISSAAVHELTTSAARAPVDSQSSRSSSRPFAPSPAT